jgi:electron transfer flavoprotein alpha subunit
MDTVVCIKQTPSPAEARFDEETKTLVREGVRLTISSLDRRALLEAIRLRDEVGGTVTVLTMGPPQARSALVEALALKADKAIHLSDPLFAGADTLATARTLALALQILKPDLILCGKFTIDSETAQVPSEVAQFLDQPQVTSVRKIQPTERSNVIWVERETDEGHEQYEVGIPALLSVTELIVRASRRPTPEELEASEKGPIEVWTSSDLGADPSLLGAAGSPTRVAELRSAELDRKGTIISGEDIEDSTQQLMNYMLANGLFDQRESPTTHRPRRKSPTKTDPSKAIWVVAELVGGVPRPVTYELLGKSQELADSLGGEVAAILLGGPEATKHVSSLASYGADTVYIANDARLANYDTEMYTTVLSTAIKRFHPYLVLIPSTTNGQDLAPRTAARLEIGLTGDCVGLELDNNGELAQIKPAFGGNIVAPIYSRTSPLMATVRPGMLDAVSPNETVRPQIIQLEVPQNVYPRVKLLNTILEPNLGATKLDDAEVVVAIGKGIGGPENVPEVKLLADAFGGALAATLPVVADQWLPNQLQLGLTGKTVAPRFYIAVGISGAPNHLVGAKKAEQIIAINNDPEAPIFQFADFGIVGDWAKVVPALTRHLQAIRAQDPI